MEVVLLLNNLTITQASKRLDKYHIAATEEAIYLINSANDYSSMIKNTFENIGEIFGVFGDVAGLVGGVVSSISGNRVADILSALSKKKSDKRLEKFLQNIDKHAAKNKGIHKISWTDLTRLSYKKGYWINGKSYVQIEAAEQEFKLRLKDNKDIDKLVNAVTSYANHATINSQFI